MGGHSGGGYSVASDSPSQFKLNVRRVLKRFRTDDHGRFGVRGQSKDRNIRHIFGDDPTADARYFYDTLGEGGQTRKMRNGRGWMKWFKDGTHVSYRPTFSSDGSPVVEITVISADIRIAPYQKIHFMKGTRQ